MKANENGFKLLLQCCLLIPIVLESITAVRTLTIISDLYVSTSTESWHVNSFRIS